MSDLVRVEKPEIISLFKSGGLNPILDQIQKEVEAFKPDLSTAKSRQEIASMAHKVTKSKTFLDKLGSELVEVQRKEIALVDAERKNARDFLDNLKNQVRKPLTEWELAEKSRIKKCELKISDMEFLLQLDSSDRLEHVERNLEELKLVEFDDDFKEFKKKATEVKFHVVNHLESVCKEIHQRLEREAELAELKRQNELLLKKQREEEEQKALLARAKREAEEAAERKLREQRLEAERVLAEEKRKAQEAARIEREKLEAAQRELAQEKLRAQRQAEEKAQAEQRAKREAEEKIRLKAEEDKRIKEQHELRLKERQEEQENINKIKSEILSDFMKVEGMTEELAISTLKAIDAEEVRYLAFTVDF